VKLAVPQNFGECDDSARCIGLSAPVRWRHSRTAYRFHNGISLWEQWGIRELPSRLIPRSAFTPEWLTPYAQPLFPTRAAPFDFRADRAYFSARRSARRMDRCRWRSGKRIAKRIKTRPTHRELDHPLFKHRRVHRTFSFSRCLSVLFTRPFFFPPHRKM